MPFYILVREKDDWTPAPPCVDLVRRGRGFGVPMEITVYLDSHHDFDAPDTLLRTLRNIATTSSHTATVGTNPQARADAIRRVSNYFAGRPKN